MRLAGQRYGGITAHDLPVWNPKHGRRGRGGAYKLWQHDEARHRSGCSRNPESDERQSAIVRIHQR